MRKDLTMMSFLFGIALSMLAFKAMGAAPVETKHKTIDFAEPPYWMASFDELNDFSTEQKKYYADTVEKKLTKVPELADVVSDDWKQAQKKYKTWEKVMTKVYQYCQAPANKQACEEIAEIRLKAFEMNQVRK